MACKRWAKYPNQNVKIASWVVEKSARKRERERNKERDRQSAIFLRSKGLILAAAEFATLQVYLQLL